jgi:histidyl-tRNA synthetase
VWRGENTQRGRYREFAQCDFDTIGTTSNAADAEVVLVIHDLMRALGFERFRIHLNNRMVLNGLLESLGLAGQTAAVLRCMDKLGKAGPEAVQAEMVERAGVTPDGAKQVLDLVLMKGDNDAILTQVEQSFSANATLAGGTGRLRELLRVVTQAGVPADCVRLDLSIARGLDYYTGTIFETFLGDLPGIGSVCSGGRYDNLASLYTKQVLPGVGASLGLDRLLAAMEELNLLDKAATAAPVFMVQFAGEHLGYYQQTARQLRAAGVGVEVFPEAKKLGQQLGYADKRGFRLALIAGPDEIAKGVWQVKDLKAQTSETVPTAELVERVRGKL